MGAFDAFRFSITINGLTALACVERATGEREVTAIGYCGGGKQLAATLPYMAAVGNDRIKSATSSPPC